MRRWALGTLLAVLLALSPPGDALSQETPRLAVDPPVQTIAPGSGLFEVSVTISGVLADSGLGGYALVMDYDPSILEARLVADSGFLESTENPVICPASNIDNETGRLAHFCLTIPIIPEPGPTIDEPQALARVTFAPVGEGTTTLDISETTIVDPEGNTMEAATENGTLSVGEPPPSPTAGETAAPDETVEPEGEAGDGGTSAGVYAGVAAAAVLGLVVVGGLLFMLRRRTGGRA